MTPTSASLPPGAATPLPRLLGFACLAGLIHGALVIGAFPPWNLWPLSFVAAAPLAALATNLARCRRGAALLALLVLFLSITPTWLWIERWTARVSDAGWPAAALYMSAWPTAFAWISARVLRQAAAGREANGTGAPGDAGGVGRVLGRAALVGIVYAGVESVRALVFIDGYPWYLLAHPLIEAPWLSQSAELWGVAPISFLCAVTGAAVAEAITLRSRPTLTALGAIAGAWALLAAAGAVRVSSLPIDPGPLVVAIQTNMPVDNRVERTMLQRDGDFRAALALSVAAVNELAGRGERPVLVAWPESVLPGVGLETDSINLQRSRNLWPGDRYVNLLDEFVRASGVPMLVGSGAFEGLREEGAEYRWHRYYNAAYLVSGERPYRRYDKLQLTPFGETMPYIRAWKALESALMSLGARGFEFRLNEGTEEVVFPLPDGTTMASPICFEDTLAPLCRRLVMERGAKAAALLVNLANDGWFGSDDAGREAHLLSARWRTVELRVGMVRAANTGISAVIDPLGRVVQSLPPRTEGFTTVRCPVSPVVTIYARLGEVGSWLFMVSTLALFIRTFLRRSIPLGATTAIVAVALLLAVGCDSQPKGRRVTTETTPKKPPDAAVAMGITGPASKQPWSTKDLSVDPDQPSAGEGDRAGKPAVPAIPVVSSGNLRQTATDLLVTAAKSSNPLHVANAIEALENDPAALRQVIRPALVNPNRGVRFVAAMAVGRLKMTDMTTLVQPLVLDPSPSVQAAAMFALSRLDQPVNLNPLAEMLRSDDPEVRGNAIMVFGDLHNPTAIPLLRSTLGSGMSRTDPLRRKITELQMAETLVKLGDDGELEPLRAALFSHPEQAEMIALSCQILARVKDGGSAGALRILAYSEGSSARPPEIRLLAFIALAALGSTDQGAAVEFGRRYLSDPNPQLRALAAREVAACAGSSALPMLEPKLYDTDATVQIAAAEAILRVTR